MSPVKLRRLSDSLKRKIEHLHNQQLSPLQIRKQILTEEDISVTTKAIKLFILRRTTEIANGKPTPKRRPQPEKRKLSQQHLDFINEKMQENDETTAPELQRMLQDVFDLSVALCTVKRYRASLGWTCTTTRYGHMVRDVNREKRVYYCRAIMQSEEQFTDVIFTDESTIKMQSNVRLSFRRENEERHIKAVPKHPYQVHVWAGISRRGATKIAVFSGKLDSEGYQDILAKFLLPFTSRVYPEGFRLYQDNDPKHKSKSTTAWLKENKVETMEAPPESPDLNPIELIWADLKYNLRKHVRPRTKDELVSGILSYWEQLEPEKLNRYIRHIYKVAPKVIALDGKATGF